jgi:hypothetical protein
METTTDPTAPEKAFDAEPEALKALQFYSDNYAQMIFAGLGMENREFVLGTKPPKCRFCDGEPPTRTFTKTAHAVSRLLGNKVIKSRYECDECNTRFSAFEDDLGKMTLPFRTVGMVPGQKRKKGEKGVPTLLSATGEAEGKSRMEFRDGTLDVSHLAGDNSFQHDEVAKTVTFSYKVQSYRPLGAYKALCKSAFTLLPPDELAHFHDLKRWLLRDDVTTDQVYASGCHLCYRSFVPGFRPFPQPFVALFRRNAQIEAHYMSMFIAFGNVSYQIFLPCPEKDEYLRGKNISVVLYPHLYQLQTWRATAPSLCDLIDLSASERTKSQTGTLSWRYDRRVKVK